MPQPTNEQPQQDDRLAALADELSTAQQQSETARLEYLEAVKETRPTQEVRDLRRAWDRARAAENALESLMLVQGAPSEVMHVVPDQQDERTPAASR